MDLLPAMKNGEVGFYDRCDGKFDGNSGTGVFDVENEVANATVQLQLFATGNNVQSADVIWEISDVALGRVSGMTIIVR